MIPRVCCKGHGPLISLVFWLQHERCGGEDPDSSAEPAVFGLSARFGETVIVLETWQPYQRNHRVNLKTCESVFKTGKQVKKRVGLGACLNATC